MPRPKKAGERARFNGFWLTDTERDRVIANWINSQPNAAESIKALIYAEATGKHTIAFFQPPTQPASEDEQPALNLNDPRVQALAAIDT
jgi:hypothetical protein